MNKKKIWLINQYANTPDQPGHTRQFEIAEYLVKNNWEIVIYSSDFNLALRRFTKLKCYELSKFEIFNGIKWNWLRVTSYKKNNWARKLNMLSFSIHLFIRLFIEGSYSVLVNKKPDIILASSPQLPAAFFSLIISKIFNINFVVEVRDLWPQVLIDQGGMKDTDLLIRILRWMEIRIYRRAKYVVLLARGCEHYVRKRGAKNTIILPNGPDLEKFPSKLFLSSVENKKNTDTFKLLYAGAHGEANGLENLIKCAEILRNESVFFTLVGDGISKSKLVKMSRNLSKVNFLKPVPKSSMPILMAEYDAILVILKDVSLFRYGISPNKLYDAYASFKPVIANIPGAINSEIKENQIGITAEPDNPLSLANAILKLKNISIKERIKMGQRARKMAETIYSRQIITKQYDHILSKIVSQNTKK